MSRNTTADAAPHNVQAERTVIGALLTDPDAIFKIDSKLCGDDFYDPVLRDVYRAIQQQSARGTPVDFVTVADQLKANARLQQAGGGAFLADVASEVPTASHIEQYAQIVIDHSKRRQLGKLGKQLSSLAGEEDRPASELLETAEQHFLELAHQSTGQRPVRLADIASEQYERYTTLYEADDPAEHYGTRTGFSTLDNFLTAMAPGHVIVLAGRPSMGKTALALDIARHVGIDQQKTVAILSLEMSKEEVFDRIFGSLCGIEPWKLTKGQLSDEQFANMGPVLDRLQDHHIYVDDDFDRTLVNIRSKARRLHMQRPLDLLIIDYLQLIQATNELARENQTQKMTYISESIKQLARELRCPILALSQLNRECERRPDKRPQLSDLRDSGSIEQDADRVLMLYRDGYYDDDAEDPYITDLYIRKNRHGPTGHCELRFDNTRMTFETVERHTPRPTVSV